MLRLRCEDCSLLTAGSVCSLCQRERAGISPYSDVEVVQDLADNLRAFLTVLRNPKKNLVLAARGTKT